MPHHVGFPLGNSNGAIVVAELDGGIAATVLTCAQGAVVVLELLKIGHGVLNACHAGGTRRIDQVRLAEVESALYKLVLVPNGFLLPDRATTRSQQRSSVLYGRASTCTSFCLLRLPLSTSSRLLLKKRVVNSSPSQADCFYEQQPSPCVIESYSATRSSSCGASSSRRRVVPSFSSSSSTFSSSSTTTVVVEVSLRHSAPE